MKERIVIVGAGQAAISFCAGLRRHGFAGDVTIIGGEDALPYERPPLSKSFLSGNADATALTLRTETYFEKAQIKLLRGVWAEAIDRRHRLVETARGPIAYDRLVIATGAQAHTITIRGIANESLYNLRTISDARALARALKRDSSIVIVGGGYLGLEVALAAIKSGASATVVEAAPAILARSCSHAFSTAIRSVHEDQGVVIRCCSKVLEGDGGRFVILDDGTCIGADAVVVAVGAAPNVGLGIECGLTVVGGAIETDDCGRTADPTIFAVGDVAAPKLKPDGPARRIESVHNAVHRGTRAARAMLGILPGRAEAPWFWSEQGALLIQSVGLVETGDRSEFRSFGSTSFTALHFRGDTLVAAECANRTEDFIKARATIDRNVSVPFSPQEAPRSNALTA